MFPRIICFGIDKQNEIDAKFKQPTKILINIDTKFPQKVSFFVIYYLKYYNHYFHLIVRFQLFTTLPPPYPADLSLVHVFIMLIYQYFPKFKSFLIANIVVGAVMAYVGEAIFVWLNYFKLND